MDILRPRRKKTWRDSAWWHATHQALISGVLMVALAGPGAVYLAHQVIALSPKMNYDSSALRAELLKGGLMMMPYLWVYFFALERIRLRRDESFSSSIYPR